MPHREVIEEVCGLRIRPKKNSSNEKLAAFSSSGTQKGTSAAVQQCSDHLVLVRGSLPRQSAIAALSDFLIQSG